METLNYFERAFADPFPSMFYMDLLYGFAGGVAIKLIVYYRSKNAKKYRQGVEYGSARWGTEKIFSHTKIRCLRIISFLQQRNG